MNTSRGVIDSVLGHVAIGVLGFDGQPHSSLSLVSGLCKSYRVLIHSSLLPACVRHTVGANEGRRSVR